MRVAEKQVDRRKAVGYLSCPPSQDLECRIVKVPVQELRDGS